MIELLPYEYQIHSLNFQFLPRNLYSHIGLVLQTYEMNKVLSDVTLHK